MTPLEPLAAQRLLVERLMTQWKQLGQPVQLFETHISWVLVVGGFAYKLKKAVQFGFLDFSTLPARRFYCAEELRLNRRTAADLYLRVAAVTGPEQSPALDGEGQVLDYAVCMRAFDQADLWEARLKSGRLSVDEIDALAELLYRFHEAAAAAPPGADWGSPAQLQANARETITSLAELAAATPHETQVAALAQWENEERRRLTPVFESRRQAARVRECHGDLHAGNVFSEGGTVKVFDCIEFNAAMRWIDVAYDLAFACMDVEARGRPDYAARLLNRYLELSGDYEVLSVWRYYVVLRALIRCKVAWLRARQSEQDESARWRQHGEQYLALAWRQLQSRPTPIILMHGLSGSGKSTLAALLADLSGAVRMRSDIERKRLHRAAEPLYDARATKRIYDRLQLLAAGVVGNGFPVIVDATFLEPERRAEFAALARSLGTPLYIVDVRASLATMRARLIARAQQGRDPSDADCAVLATQLAAFRPLDATEADQIFVVDFESEPGAASVRAQCAPLLAAMQAPNGCGRS